MVVLFNLKFLFSFLEMFLFTEKKYLEGLKRDIDLSLFFPEDEIQFLKEKHRYHQIQSRVSLLNIKIKMKVIQ